MEPSSGTQPGATDGWTSRRAQHHFDLPGCARAACDSLGDDPVAARLADALIALCAHTPSGCLDMRRQRPADEWLLIDDPTKRRNHQILSVHAARNISFRHLVDVAKISGALSALEQLEQEVELAHYEGRGWRASLTSHALPRGLRLPDLPAGDFPPQDLPPPRSYRLTVPTDYRPRGAAAAARAAHSQLDRNHAPTPNRRPRQEPSAIPCSAAPIGSGCRASNCAAVVYTRLALTSPAMTT